MTDIHRTRFVNRARLGGFIVAPLTESSDGKTYSFRVETFHLGGASADRVITTAHNIVVDRNLYNSIPTLAATDLGHYVIIKGRRLPSQEVLVTSFGNLSLVLKHLSADIMMSEVLKRSLQPFSDNEMAVAGYVVAPVVDRVAGRGYTFSIKTVFPCAPSPLTTIHTVFISPDTYSSCSALRTTKRGDYVFIEGLFSAARHIVLHNFINFSLMSIQSTPKDSE